MPAHPIRRAIGAFIDGFPWPSTIIGVLLVAIVGLALAGGAWSPSAPAGPAPVIAITPDDPAAATPVPVQDLER
jgi:hypothetical protein